eukprot:7488461-Pyramimonas_sp.AAC.1
MGGGAQRSRDGDDVLDNLELLSPGAGAFGQARTARWSSCQRRGSVEQAAVVGGRLVGALPP